MEDFDEGMENIDTVVSERQTKTDSFAFLLRKLFMKI